MVGVSSDGLARVLSFAGTPETRGDRTTSANFVNQYACINLILAPKGGCYSEIRPRGENGPASRSIANDKQSKAHVRGLMHLVFRCAERWCLIEMGKNPIALVRVKDCTKRLKRPRVLKVEQFCAMLPHLKQPYRTMVIVAQCLGLRVSEIVALKWGDFDFNDRVLLVQRSAVSRPNTHTILFRSMMIWQKCCSTGNSRAATNGMRIGFSQIPPRRSLTGKKKSRRSTSNPLQKRLAWAPESAGIHSDTHLGRSPMKPERR